MPQLMIKCPFTNKPVPTGMSVPKGSNLKGFKNNSISCPHCGGKHTWNGPDAFFLE